MEAHMRRTTMFVAPLFFGVSLCVLSQDSAPKPNVGTHAQFAAPNLIKVTGMLGNANSQPVANDTIAITFAIYREERGDAALWQEVQTVAVNSAGHYDVLLGATAGHRLPSELFDSHKMHWLGVKVQGKNELPRVLLASAADMSMASEPDTLTENPISASELARSTVTTDFIRELHTAPPRTTLAPTTTTSAAQPGTSAGQTQTFCTTPILSWEGSYTLSTSATMACLGSNIGGGTCTYSSGVTASPNFSPLSQSCTSLSWASIINATQTQEDTVTSVAVNDTATVPCGPPYTGNITETYIGSAGTSGSTLNIDLSNGTYNYDAEPYGNLTYTLSTCAYSESAPATPFLGPVSNWPQNFTLPSTIQPLTVTNFSFQGLYPVFDTSQVIPWTYSFTLTPKAECEPCKQNGGGSEGQGMPVSSSISAQNASLGEDLPIAGTGFNLHYESSRAPGAAAIATANADAAMIGGWTLNVHHAYDAATNTLFLGDGSQRRGYELGTGVPFNGNVLLTSEDGSEVYAFSLTTGKHLQTLRPMTGALLYQFGYDAAGNLVTVTDASGNLTTIQRNASEQPTAIVSPFGQTTTLTVDGQGFLSKVTDPLGNSVLLVNSVNGLLTSRTDANGNIFNYTYDAAGRLSKDADPLGGFVMLARTNAATGFGWTVGETTSMGRTSGYQTTMSLPWALSSTSTVNEQHTNTWPSGLQATSGTTLQNGQLSESSTLPDGTTSSTTLSPDPRWGLQAPLPNTTLTIGSLTGSSSHTRSVNLGTAANPFSLTSQTDTETVNGRVFTSGFTASIKTYLNTSPMGRQTTQVLDSLERISSLQIGTLLPMSFTYETRGRLSTVTQGTRVTSMAYDTNGFLASVTDPLNLTTTFTYDADGRLTSSTLPDGRSISYASDANGNRTSVTPPGRSAHRFTYTPVNLQSTYAPPTISGTAVTNYSYDLDRKLTKISRPDGATISYGNDSAGRISSETTPTATINYTYDATTGNLASAIITGGESLAFGYIGLLLTSATWTGTVAGSVGLTYNNNFWTASESLNGGNTVSFSYDNDGLLTQTGALSLNYDSNGLLTSTTLGETQDSRIYNGFGELVSYSGSYSGNPLYSISLSRDNSGRVVGKQETVNGKSSSDDYAYDVAGRLIQVTHHITTSIQPSSTAGPLCPVWGCTPPPVISTGPIHSYSYDSNSNRLSEAMLFGTTVIGTYDAQDRMLTYGNASYTYTANGELVSRTTGSETTSYQYDVLGNLIAATVPGGKAITYVIDAANHLVGRRVNGVLATGFLYDDDNLVAQLDGNNQVVNQFVYGSRSNSPDYMLQAGITYRIFSDQLGSPRLVVNASTGQIAEQIDYDVFGNVTKDTNPGFQPFGFGGGLYDQDTKLVRFGARDYDPSTGRWTAKDPILFAADDPNLYSYVMNDPINLVDPSGLQSAQWDCDACTEQTKEAGKKILKMYGKTLGKSEAERRQTIREGIEEELKPPSPREEYQKQLERARDRANDSVNPFSRWLQKVWRKCAEALQ
jgi:RHS repeat-associated protein